MSGKKIVLMLWSFCLINSAAIVASDANEVDTFKTPTKTHASISSAGQSTLPTPYTPNSGKIIEFLNITLNDLKADGENFTTEQLNEFERVTLEKFRDLIAAINSLDNEKIKNEMIFLIESEIVTLRTRDELLKKIDELLKKRDEPLKKVDEPLKKIDELLKKIDELKNQLEAYKNKDNKIIASPSASINFDPESLSETTPLFNNNQIEYPAKTNNWDYLKIFIKSFGVGFGAATCVVLGIFLLTHFSK